MNTVAILGSATSARIKELGRAIVVNRLARGAYSADPARYAILIRHCDQRIQEAQVELHNIEAALDALTAAAQQLEADKARRAT